ncbi:MAG: TonB-dependent receptor, partial [Sphingomonadaceae bacterium]|nr:TonB-dependent receptor [Sphingomonadaceae bacterium]
MTPFATRYLSVLLAGSALIAVPALAQEAAPSAPATTAEVEDVQDGNEIVVTAQRREQKLQDVPLSVSALGTEALERAGIQTVGNIGNSIPNIQVNQTIGNTFGPLITIRGLAPSADTSLARDQPVGIYVDGVPVAKSTGAAFDLVDLERVEVLRGPQGTLYGKNTIGGAVNLVTK